MILRTTRCRLSRMISAAHALENYPLALELAEARFSGESDRAQAVCAEMPYLAGIRLGEAMTDVCYTGRGDDGAMRRGLSSSEFGALRDVMRATNEEWRHPALRGIGMASHYARVFHVWANGDGTWSPEPVAGVGMEILRPIWHVDEEGPSTKFTLWSNDKRLFSPPSRLDDESLHWAFV